MKFLLKSSVLLIVLLGGSFDLFSQQDALTTVILVRHAEKEKDGTKDPELSQKGIERSNKLASLFSKLVIDAVFSTDYKRTKNTVAALADSKGLHVNIYSPDVPDYFNNILQQHRGKTILICGHSNTIPALANQILGKRQYNDFEDDDYSNVLVITFSKVGEGKVTHLSY